MKTLALLLCLAPTVAAAQTPAKRWKNAAEISIVSASGNSRTTTTAAKNLYEYAFDPASKLELEGGGLGARSQGQMTAEQYFAALKGTRKVDERNYLFSKYRWDKNRFAGIIHRHDLSAGVGRELIKTPKDLLIGEAAPGYMNEERAREKRRSFATGRLYSKYTRELSATAKFSQDIEYLQSLQLAKDNRFAMETALIAALTSIASLKLSYQWKRNNQPPPGVSKDDTLTSVALLASF